MVDISFLPVLSSFDIERAAELIQRAYASPTALTEDLKRLQQELFELQKRPEAWGLIIPLLDHQDQHVQFFGAHTAQVKIVRDWETFPPEHAHSLRDLIVQLTAHSMTVRRTKFILRKLFVAVTSLALKLVPGHPSRWQDWVAVCVTSFSERRAPQEHIHDFLIIVAEEVGNADLLGSSKAQIQQSLTDAIPLVLQVVRSSLDSFQHLPSGLRCLQAWMGLIRSSEITPLIPILITLLDRFETDTEIFIAASDTLQEIMSKSPLSDGSGSRTLTEPLLIWIDTIGGQIVEKALKTGDVDEVSHSFCKLLVALGDHSTSYIAAHIASTAPIIPLAPMGPPLGTHYISKSKGHLTQNFLRVLLAYTGLPGYYGVDEEESDMTLSFWYLFQEALWSNDYYMPEEEEGQENTNKGEDQHDSQVTMAKAVYSELVQVLRRKVAFPSKGSGWSKDQIDKFKVYRRDVGDTLLNAYYVLRDDMLGYYVEDINQRLTTRQEDEGWQEIEATLHCIMSVQEAMDMEKTQHLPRLFSPEILGRLPSTGHGRIRRTTLAVIGIYASWFASQPSDSSALLMNVVSYVVSALTDPLLCLQAAIALRNLCDANRKVLAPQISAFAELHAGIESIPDTEKSKVLQSISSVIQALPPSEEIAPIEAIVDPIVQKLAEVLQSSSTLPDEARVMAIQQLEALSGVAKGLTRSTEGLLIFSEEDASAQAKTHEMTKAREDVRMIKLRDAIFVATRGVVNLWSTDAEVSHALSDLFKSITCLPNDTTLITLPAGPLLELVCLASQRQLTATWLSLAAILIAQLNPPPSILVSNTTVNTGPTAEARVIVNSALPVLLGCSLSMLGVPGAMENNPDVVQEFFACMDRVAQDFTASFYHSLPPSALDALINCAITALALQERYSLVSACNFLSVLLHRTSLHETLSSDKERVLQIHGRNIMKAVLEGFASIAPRSAVPNLIEMLGTLLGRAGGGGAAGAGGIVATTWMREVLFSDNFVPSKATPEIKEKFIKAVVSSRSLKRTREAAQQFTLIARGLEGSGFGYASVSM